LAQQALWKIRSEGVVRVEDLSDVELDTARVYMSRFSDVPCDFADANLLACCELRCLTEVLTLDSDFYAYRVGGKALQVRFLAGF